jgi:hypothetical protein
MVLWLDRIRGKWSSSSLKEHRSLGKGGHFEARIPPLLNLLILLQAITTWLFHSLIEASFIQTCI